VPSSVADVFRGSAATGYGLGQDFIAGNVTHRCALPSALFQDELVVCGGTFHFSIGSELDAQRRAITLRVDEANCGRNEHEAGTLPPHCWPATDYDYGHDGTSAILVRSH